MSRKCRAWSKYGGSHVNSQNSLCKEAFGAGWEAGRRAGMEDAARIASNHADKLIDEQSQCHNIGHEYQMFGAKIQTALSLDSAVRAKMEEEK